MNNTIFPNKFKAALAAHQVQIGCWSALASPISTEVLGLAGFDWLVLDGEHAPNEFSWILVAITVGLGLASAFIQMVMNWAQRFVDPAQAAIIYAGEPVWAGIFGRIAGERLPFIALLGGALVVFAVIISQLKPKFLKSKAVSKDLS